MYFSNCRDPIEKFIDENKALIRRMYGDFQATPSAASANGNGGGGGSGSRRSVRGLDDGDAPPWHLRDAELFAEDLDDALIAGGQVLANATRPRRQSTSRNTPPPMKEAKDNKFVNFFFNQSINPRKTAIPIPLAATE